MLIVRSGVWLYDGSVETPVDIVAFEFDWWHRLAADDAPEQDEPKPVGPDGLLYYVRFKHAGDAAVPTWVDSAGHDTVDEAMRTAATKAPSPIVWGA